MANGQPSNSRLTIQFEVDGYPCSLAFEVTAADIATRIDAAIQAIQAAGATPPRAAQAAALASPNVPAPASNGTGEPPRCPYHGPMKESKKAPGTWFCPAKMGDGESYCKEKWPK